MHHIIIVNKQKNRFKKQNKGDFRLASEFSWLKPYRERLGNNNQGELQKENISKRSILINRIKEIWKHYIPSH